MCSGRSTAAVGALQAADALKILSGHADRIPPRLTTMECGQAMCFRARPLIATRIVRHAAKGNSAILTDKHAGRSVLCGRNAVQISERTTRIDLNALARQLAPVGEVKVNEFLLRVDIGEIELTVFRDGRAIIKGTSDTAAARGIYARYVGM